MNRTPILKIKQHLAEVALLLLVLVGVGCSSSNLTPLTQVIASSTSNTGVQFNFCTDPATTQKQYLKMVVILDHSGSNQANYLMSTDGTGAPQLVGGTVDISTTYATDPTGQTRYGTTATKGTFLNYLANLPANDPADPTRFFALIDFNAQASLVPAGATGFTSDIPTFYSNVLTDSKATGTVPIDNGATSYLSALAKAYTIINNDVTQAESCAAMSTSATPTTNCPTPGVANASSYVIVFMSDGSPITSISGIAQNGGGQIVVTGTINVNKESSTAILGEVGAITALASNTKYVSSVNMFTIYYYYPGNIDASGQSLLANMAKAGNGIAYDALSGSNIDYTQFEPPTKLIKYQLGDVFVTNATAAYWSDGKLYADSDMDGLPDFVERAWGSDPNNADTFKNGVSDLVKYRLSNAQACTTKNGSGICIDSVTNYASGSCSGISHASSGGVVTFSSKDPDGLNDCEKLALADTSGIGLPDSNGDLIPDFLEFKNNLPFQIGTTSANNSSNQDGYTSYQKIKLSLPTNVSASQLLNYTPANYSLQQVSTSTLQDCYTLSVTNLPTVTSADTARIDVIETNPADSSRTLYRVGKKKFSASSPLVQFNDWNNSAEQLAGTWSVTQ